MTSGSVGGGWRGRSLQPSGLLLPVQVEEDDDERLQRFFMLAKLTLTEQEQLAFSIALAVT